MTTTEKAQTVKRCLLSTQHGRKKDDTVSACVLKLITKILPSKFTKNVFIQSQDQF
jgi:hypothetical protein